jgi:hypothetical protein
MVVVVVGVVVVKAAAAAAAIQYSSSNDKGTQRCTLVNCSKSGKNRKKC